MGKRLGDLTKGNTKCMVRVNGKTLIDRLLRQLSSLSLERIILVVGYEGAKLRSYVEENYGDMPVQFVDNPVYDKTNNIYSLSLVKDQLQEDDTLLIESDLIFEDGIFSKILASPYQNVVLVDKYEAWMDGTMVCVDEDYNIVNIVPKQAFSYKEIDSYYKTVNIYKFSKEFLAKKYIPFLEAYTQALGNNEYYEQVLRVITLLENCDLHALPLEGEKWYEIDDIQDLDIAETLFSKSSERLEKIQKRYGGYWRFPSLLDFCYLVNPYFPTLMMKEEIKANFDNLLTQYPSGMSVNALLAGKYFGIRKEFVCVGNGAAELIKSVLSRIKGKIGVVFPTFEEYPNRVEEAGNLVSYVPSHPDFAYTKADIISVFSDKELETLLLINPDNPSGNYICKSDMMDLLRWSSEKNIRLIVDESFLDFAEEGPEASLLDNAILAAYPNLIVIKSISKSYGVPGLRLGVLASSDLELISWMKKDVSIWNINSFAEFYLQIFGKYAKDYKRACHKFRQERARFMDELNKISFIRVIPSQANYFLCELKGKYTSYELTRTLLAEFNILIKDCGTKKAFANGNYVRIAVRDEKDNNRLVEALRRLD